MFVLGEFRQCAYDGQCYRDRWWLDADWVERQENDWGEREQIVESGVVFVNISNQFHLI